MTSQKGRSDEPRINQGIRAPEVRLIDKSGEMIGVYSVADALKKAEIAGVDLVEIVPNSKPPVCKIMDYGKFKYEAQKKAHDARKKQKVIVLKEIKLRPTIDKNDLEIKTRNAIKFLEEGDKVKVSLRFRGREITHKEVGLKVIGEVREALEPYGKIESEPRFEGMQVVMILGPK